MSTATALDLKTLVLNADYRPLSPWPLSLIAGTDAIRAVYKGRVTVVENWDQALHSPSREILVPKVVALNDYAPIAQSPKFCRRSILLRDRFRCFPAGTRILMANGRQTAIEDVRVGDRVIDAFGKPRTVIDHGARVADNCVAIKHRGSFERTLVTKDHPFLGQDGKFVEIGKMEVAEQRGGSYLSFPRKVDYEIHPATELTLPALLPTDRWFLVRGGRVYRTRKNTDQGLPLRLPQSPGLAYLLGLYVAEGSATDSGLVCFSFCSDEEQTLAVDAANLLREEFGLAPATDLNEARNTCTVRVGSKSLAEILRTHCGKGSRNKRTPWDLVGPYHTDYLRGLFAGDSCIDNTRHKVVLSMTSTDAIFGAQSMLWGLGIFPTLQCIEVVGKLPSYALVLNAANRSAFMDKVMGLKVEYGETIFGNDTHILRRLQERPEIEGDVLTFNIEVEGSNSYIANGLAVHNCQYCGGQFRADELTFDHVIPRAKGGKTEWTNILCACVDCNGRKRDNMPNFSGRRGKTNSAALRPLKEPRQPTTYELLKAGLEFLDPAIKEDYGSWLYWTTDLEA